MSAPTPLAAAPAPAPAYDVGRLDARVAALESGQLRTAQAAAAALAAAAVVEATQSSGPFTDEIAGLRAVSAPSAELRARRTRSRARAAPAVLSRSRAALRCRTADLAASKGWIAASPSISLWAPSSKPSL